ncbi:hypothetical protein [Tenacibaculum agarivorans]|uniref:hypothetical protein n=1 Tax=Tenacibaculum agarivorans TaxID=1908389 RepID=UPI00094B85FC|nr:hypothetical protein [Tenacibaculum agarivorans]
MFKTKAPIPVLWLCLCFSIYTFSQTPVSGFYPKKNSLTVATSFTYKGYDKFYRGTTLTETTPANMGEITSSIFGLYSEYGINNWLSASLSLPYIDIQNANNTPDPVHQESQQNGVQNLGLYVKARVFKKDFSNGSNITLGGATGIDFPTNQYVGNAILTIGNRATSFDNMFIAQYTTNFNLFTELETGYSIRTNSDFDIPNAVLYSFKLGYYNEWIYTHAKIGVQDSVSGYDIGTPEFVANGGPAALSQTQVDYTNLYLDVYAPIYKQKIGVSVGYAMNLDGRNFGNESGFSAGLIYKN